MQSDVDITEIVDALDRLNLLDTHMQRLVTLLMEKFLEPMCKQHLYVDIIVAKVIYEKRKREKKI